MKWPAPHTERFNAVAPVSMSDEHRRIQDRTVVALQEAVRSQERRTAIQQDQGKTLDTRQTR